MKTKEIALDEMRAKQLPRLDWRTMFEITGEIDGESSGALDRYFRGFLPPSEKCASCDTPQGGMMGALLGGFVYDIIHGEGHCGNCGWPGRANHYNVGPIESLSLILQYHPDDLDVTNRGRETNDV